MKMSSLSDYNRRELLSELWRKIESCHLCYLEHDDGPEKLKSRKKLEGYISEYLQIVPHEFKFGLTETATVLNKSIEQLHNFSGYEACQGWQAIARYAANLLSQPWRKEYRTIRTYCGYYKHEVESNLFGASVMLELMGYKSVGGGRLVMDGPICPDAVTAVSRDALLAYVHCQLLCGDWETAWSRGQNLTWRQVAFQRQQDSNQYDMTKHIYSNSNGRKESPLVNYNHTYEQSSPVRMRSQPSRSQRIVSQHTTLPNTLPNQSRSFQDQYAHRSIPEYCLTDAPYSYTQPLVQPYYYGMQNQPNYIIQPQMYGHPNVIYNEMAHSVPTGQLIELDYSDRSPKRLPDEVRIPRSDTQPTLSSNRDDCAGSYESWDYVFRNLESHERGRNSCLKDSKTLERHRERTSGRFQPMTLDLEDGLKAMSLDKSQEEEMNRMARVNETLLKLKQSEAKKKQRKLEEAKKNEERKAEERKLEELRKQKKTMIEEARRLEEGRKAEEVRKLEERRKLEEKKDELRKQKLNEDAKSGIVLQNGCVSDSKVVSVPKISPNVRMNGEASRSEKVNGAKERENGLINHENGIKQLESTSNGRGTDEVDSSRLKLSGKWNCGACTYLNAQNVKVCAMCGKSRDWDASGTRLQSGGRECPACTLVNPRRATECTACATSLNHSPTYI